MSDKQLDNLFKKKLSKRNFEYNDAYWDSFEKSFDLDAVGRSSAGSAGKGAMSTQAGGIGGIAKIALLVAAVAGFSVMIYWLTGNRNEQSPVKDIAAPDTEIIREDLSPGTIKPDPSNKGSVFEMQDESISKSPESGNNDAINSQEQQGFSGEEKNKAVAGGEINAENNDEVVAGGSKRAEDDVTSGKNSQTEKVDIAPGIAGSAEIKKDKPIDQTGQVAKVNAGKETIDSEALSGEGDASLPGYSSGTGIQVDDVLKPSSVPIDIAGAQKDTIYKPKNQQVAVMKISRALPEFSVAGYGAIAFISKNLDYDNPGYSELIDNRSQYELNKTSFTYGLEFRAKYKGFTFATGLERMDWGEKTNYVSTEDVYEYIDTTIINIIDNSYWEYIWIPDSISGDTIIIDSTYIIDIDTTIIEISDTILVEEGKNLGQYNGTTHITYVEIPLIAGYEVTLNKVLLSFRAGVSVGFLTRTEGYYLEIGGNDMIPINTGYAVIRKTIWNIHLGIGAGYKFNDHFNLYFDARFKANLKSILREGIISQRYRAFILGVKLRYVF